MSERDTALAGFGVVGVVLAYVIGEHLLNVEWQTSLPLPMAWWAVAFLAGLLGLPLMLTALGRGLTRFDDASWGWLLRSWVLPMLAGHLVWAVVVVLLMRRFNPGFAGLPARSTDELLGLVLFPPPEMSILWSLALTPVLVKLARRVPAPTVVLVLGLATLLTPALTFVVFVFLGTRLTMADEAVPMRDLIARGALAAAGATVLRVARFPQGPDVVLAGLAALPLALGLGLGLTAKPRFRWAEMAGPATVHINLLLFPVLMMADGLLLGRLSQQGSAVQLVAALVEPVALTVGIVGGGVILAVLIRRVTGKRQRTEVHG